MKAKLAELIVRWSEEHAGEEPDRASIADLERRAAVASRPPKVDGLDAATLHQEWVEQALALGFDPARLTPERLTASPPPGPPSDEALILEAVRLTQDESATWLRADLARHLSNLVPSGLVRSGAEIVEHIDRLAAVAEQRCIEVGPTVGGPTRRDGRPVSKPSQAGCSPRARCSTKRSASNGGPSMRSPQRWPP